MPRTAWDRRSGFTLAELLVALAIAVLVAGISWLLLGTVTRAVISHQERNDRRAMAGRALQRVQADLTSLFVPAEDPECALTLTADPFSASFCAMKKSDALRANAREIPTRIQYKLVDSGSEGRTLLRIESTLSGEIRSETNRLAVGVEQWNLTLHDGSQWHSNWPPSEIAAEKPRAARASIRLAGMDAALHAEWWIPVGYIATSRTIRAAAP